MLIVDLELIGQLVLVATTDDEVSEPIVAFLLTLGQIGNLSNRHLNTHAHDTQIQAESLVVHGFLGLARGSSGHGEGIQVPCLQQFLVFSTQVDRQLSQKHSEEVVLWQHKGGLELLVVATELLLLRRDAHLFLRELLLDVDLGDVLLRLASLHDGVELLVLHEDLHFSSFEALELSTNSLVVDLATMLKARAFKLGFEAHLLVLSQDNLHLMLDELEESVILEVALKRALVSNTGLLGFSKAIIKSLSFVAEAGLQLENNVLDGSFVNYEVRIHCNHGGLVFLAELIVERSTLRLVQVSIESVVVNIVLVLVVTAAVVLLDQVLVDLTVELESRPQDPLNKAVVLEPAVQRSVVKLLQVSLLSLQLLELIEHVNVVALEELVHLLKDYLQLLLVSSQLACANRLLFWEELALLDAVLVGSHLESSYKFLHVEDVGLHIVLAVGIQNSLNLRAAQLSNAKYLLNTHNGLFYWNLVHSSVGVLLERLLDEHGITIQLSNQLDKV